MRVFRARAENNKGCSIYHRLLFSDDRKRLREVYDRLFREGIIDAMWDETDRLDIDPERAVGDEEAEIRKLARWFGLYGASADRYASMGWKRASTAITADMIEKTRRIIERISDGKVAY